MSLETEDCGLWLVSRTKGFKESVTKGAVRKKYENFQLC